MKEIEIKKTKKSKRFKIIVVALVAFAVYASVTLVSQQMQISQKTSVYNSLKDQIVIEEVKTDEIKEIDESGQEGNDAYIEQKAREDFDYAYRDERIFINIAG